MPDLDPFTDLDEQWNRLNAGFESPADVASSLAAWRRDCLALVMTSTLAEAMEVLRYGQDRDHVLRFFLVRAQHGDQIAHRLVLQAFLPLIVKTVTIYGSDVAFESISRVWELAATIPTDKPLKYVLYFAMRIQHPRDRVDRRERAVDPGTFSADSPWGTPLHWRVHRPSETHECDFELLLRDLGERDRELIRLVYLQGHPVCGAARLMGLSPSQASKRLSRALARLRDQLQPVMAA